MVEVEAAMALARYWKAADINLEVVEEIAFGRRKGRPFPKRKDFRELSPHEWLYWRIAMEQWLGLLYVVVEGYRELKMPSRRVDAMLDTDYVNLLRLFRNKAFHYKPAWSSEKHDEIIHSDMMKDVGPYRALSPLSWARELHRSFEIYVQRHTLWVRKVPGSEKAFPSHLEAIKRREARKLKSS